MVQYMWHDTTIRKTQWKRVRAAGSWTERQPKEKSHNHQHQQKVGQRWEKKGHDNQNENSKSWETNAYTIQNPKHEIQIFTARRILITSNYLKAKVIADKTMQGQYTTIYHHTQGFYTSNSIDQTSQISTVTQQLRKIPVRHDGDLAQRGGS